MDKVKRVFKMMMNVKEAKEKVIEAALKFAPINNDLLEAIELLEKAAA